MSSPLFSIIIPTYNAGKTLQHALESIMQQTFTNWEVIVVDGLSKDDTVSIAHNKRAQDGRIQVVSEKDRGIYDAMNKGISMAKANWLYFMGGDDSLYNKNVLQKVSETLQAAPCDLLYGEVYSTRLKGNYGGMYDKEKILFSNPCHQAIFYNKHIYERIGNYNIAYTSFADWDFNIRCFFDDTIKKQYTPVTVACFAEGGASTTRPDLLFLRYSLFPQNITLLNIQGVKKLYNIRLYDTWWRLIRSMQLEKDNEDIAQYAPGQVIPPVIKQMAAWQKRIPYGVLRVGVMSKMLAAMSYCSSLIRRRFSR